MTYSTQITDTAKTATPQTGFLTTEARPPPGESHRRETATPQTGFSTIVAHPPPGGSLPRAEEAVLATAPKQRVADATTAQNRFLAAMAASEPDATPFLWKDDSADRSRSN
jgi:hypothetical protein